MKLHEDLIAAFGVERVRQGVLLAPFTTFKIGGPADWLLEAHGSGEVLTALEIARASHVSVTLLGGGSNVLVGDRGVRGLVLRVRGGVITNEGPGLVRADAGVTINELARWTVARGLAGIEKWTGTPGTVGGAVFGNTHFDGCLIGEVIDSVGVVTPEGQVRDVRATEMEFEYDASRLRRTREIVLWAMFRVTPGDTSMLRACARRSLARRKRTQPLDAACAGCIFRNPDPSRDVLPAGFPASAGALLDGAGLKGHRAGGACVSTMHANFIVNEGNATSNDVRTLVEICRKAVAEKFGVTLREEIEYLGEF